MLVGAFEIKIGAILLRPGRLDGLFHREDMRRAGIEPDVENVLHLLVIVGDCGIAEEARRRRIEPGVGAFLLERLDDARVDRRIVEDFAGLSFPRRSRAARPRRAGATAPSRGGLPPSSRCGSAPAADTIWCRAIACIAIWRKVLPFEALNGLSIAANHCGVARKITGALERQECGY